MKKFLKRIYHKVNRTLNKSDIKELPLEPYSRKMGWERGTPIDRIYIERFLEANKKYICGTVMEISEDTYTKKYGNTVEKSIIFTADESDKRDNVIIGDLQSGNGLKDVLVNCFILTQTLRFIYDIQNSTKNIIKALAENGTALVTFRGISQISMYDYSRWGDYWGFTKLSISKLVEEAGGELVELCQYGNVKTATSFLYGLSYEDMKKEDFEYQDELFPVIFGAVIKKKNQ